MNGRLRTAVATAAALSGLLLTACDSGGPPAVPGPWVAPSAPAAPTIPADEVVYLAGLTTVRAASGEVARSRTGLTGRLNGRLVYTGGRLFEFRYPPGGIGGNLIVEEFDPRSFKSLGVLYKRRVEEADSPEGRYETATMIASHDGTRLYVLYNEPAAATSARLGLFEVDLRTAAVREAPPVEGVRWGRVWAHVDPAARYLTALTFDPVTLGLASVQFDLVAMAPIGEPVTPPPGDEPGSVGDVLWSSDSVPHVLQDSATSLRVVVRSLADGTTVPLPDPGDPGIASTDLVFAIAPGGEAAYFVTDSIPQRALHIDLVPGLPVRSTEVPATAALPRGGPLEFVGSVLEGLVELVLGSPASAKFLGLGSPPAVSPDGSTLYFFGVENIPYEDRFGTQRDRAPSGIRVVDTASMTVRAHLRPGERWVGDIVVSPDGRRLYVADGESGSLLVLDAGTGATLAEVGGLQAELFYSPAFLGFASQDWVGTPLP